MRASSWTRRHWRRSSTSASVPSSAISTSVSPICRSRRSTSLHHGCCVSRRQAQLPRHPALRRAGRVAGAVPALNTQLLRELFDHRMQETPLILGPRFEDASALQEPFRRLQQAIRERRRVHFVYAKGNASKADVDAPLQAYQPRPRLVSRRHRCRGCAQAQGLYAEQDRGPAG